MPLEVGGVGQHEVGEAVISDWNASHTTRNGILYSPSLALVVEHLADLDVFIVEFQAMLAMKIISVSIGTGRRARRW